MTQPGPTERTTADRSDRGRGRPTAGWLLLAALLLHGCAAPKGLTGPRPTADSTIAPRTSTGDLPAAAETRRRAGVPPTVDLVELAPGVRVDRTARRVEIDAEVSLDVGTLEQVLCGRGSREHESILVTDAAPSAVHAGLLLIGLEPGRPGRWALSGETLELVPPTGAVVDVLLALDRDGVRREESVASWIRGFAGGEALPDEPWVFAGSAIVPNHRDPAKVTGERYVADVSGSLIGLVTFGDEVLARADVQPDQEAVVALEWEAWTERIPAPGTRVTVVLTPVTP